MNFDDLTEQELANFDDPFWRLTCGKLYKIKTADGRGIIPFEPRPEQVELLRKLVDDVEAAKLIHTLPEDQRPIPPQEAEIKSRRLGYSTTIGVFVADCIAFRKSFTAQLIDQTAAEAAKKMNGIVKIAVDALIDRGWPLVKIKSNDSELTIDQADAEESAPSTFFADVKGRGGSVDFGWYSELGVIQFDDEKRAEEIITGAFLAARHGVKVIETTWKGGKGGHVWNLIKHTLNGTAADWRVHFTPWYVDPRNVAPLAAMDQEALTYFAGIEERLAKEGIVLSEAQRRWWAQERRTLGIFMLRENPTFLDECWRAPIEGAIYAPAIDRARTERRIIPLPVDGGSLVNTSWDLGAPRNMPCWYWQVVGREIRIIDYDSGWDGTLVSRVAMMLAKGYSYGTHYLPHDSKKTESTGTNFAAELRNCGLGQVETVERTASVWISINHALQLMPSIVWCLNPAVEQGLAALAAYREKIVGNGAIARNEPVHDWASHTADAFRTMVEAEKHGLFKYGGGSARATEDGRRWPGQPRKGMKPRRVSA